MANQKVSAMNAVPVATKDIKMPTDQEQVGVGNYAITIEQILALAGYSNESIDTSGATITLDFLSGFAGSFVGSASFATSKAVAFSNATNALRFVLFFEISNVAATLVFPSNTTMSDPRWTDSTHTLNMNPDTGKFKLTADYNGTDWHMQLSGPYP